MTSIRERCRTLGAFASYALSLVTFVNAYDYAVFRNWVLAALMLGLLDLYAGSAIFGHAFRVVYPPLAPLMFVASALAVVCLQPLYLLPYYPPLLLRVAVKAPLLASVIVLYKVVEARVSPEAARMVVLNVLMVALAHAYVFEYPAIALLMLALYVASPIASAVLLALATMLKHSLALAALPMLLFFLARGAAQALRYVVAYVATVSAVMAPFALANGLGMLLSSMVEFHTLRPPQGTNLWTAVLVLSGYDAGLATSISSSWPAVLAALGGLALIRIGRPRSIVDLERLTAALLVSLLLSSKVLNPHYMLWALPLIAVLAWRGAISMRAYRAYTAAGLIELAYPVFTLFGAAVLRRPFYIEEEARWMPPEEVERIVKGAFPELMPAILELVRSSPLYILFEVVYDQWHIVLPGLAAAYTVLLAYVYVELVRR